MSDKQDEENDMFQMVNLLAGAAQAGAQGVLAQAAFNFVKASEAKIKAKKLNNDNMRDRAQELFVHCRDIFMQLANDKEALAEGKQDIISHDAQAYDFETTT